MNKLPLIVCLVCIVGLSKAQTVIIEEEPDTVQELASGNYGANRQHYVQAYYGIGVCFSEGFGSNYPLRSGSIELGTRYKRKLSNVLAITWLMGWQRNRFANETSALGREWEHIYNTNTWMMLHTSLGPRINFDVNRGNFVGTYIEFRAVGGIIHNVINRNKQKHLIDDSRHMQRTSWPEWSTNRLVGGLAIELGSNVLALQFQYIPSLNVEVWNGNEIRTEPFTISMLINAPG